MVKKYCNNCGYFITVDSKFCASCGAPQVGAEATKFFANAPTVPMTAGSVALASAQKPKTGTKQSPKGHFIRKKHLCTPVIISFMVSYFAKTSILLLLFGISLFINPVIAAVAILFYVATVYLTAVMVYNNFYYEIDEHGFKKWHGILHKKKVSIPYNQIQNVIITRNLGDIILGLSRINIETAGGVDTSSREIAGGSQTMSEGHLPGVTLEEAKRIHDLLLQYSKAS